jgi:hypothetical protein
MRSNRLFDATSKVVRAFGAPFRLPPVNSDVRQHITSVEEKTWDYSAIFSEVGSTRTH